MTPSALILAAGRGERMRPLTDHLPKPLLTVQGKPLLQWHLEALARAGVTDGVINTAWCGEQVPLKFGSAFEGPGAPPIRLTYSMEGQDFGGALETLGGIVRALPTLSLEGRRPFWVVAGDVFMPGFAFDTQAVHTLMQGSALAHLWLVPNPAHNPKGDFYVTPEGGMRYAEVPGEPAPQRYTFSTVGLYRPELFSAPWCDIAPGNPLGVKAPLGVFLRRAADAGRVTAQIYHGPWTDVGTPERLAQLNLSYPFA